MSEKESKMNPEIPRAVQLRCPDCGIHFRPAEARTEINGAVYCPYCNEKFYPY